MGQNKESNVNFKTQPALKLSFEEALAEQKQFGSATGFFEDAMRAFILAVRQKKEMAVPLEFLERGKSGK